MAASPDRSSEDPMRVVDVTDFGASPDATPEQNIAAIHTAMRVAGNLGVPAYLRAGNYDCRVEEWDR